VVLPQTHPIYVVFAVPSAHLAQIYPHWSRGDALTVQALDRDGKVLASGKLAAVDNQIDTSTGTIRIKAQFDNSNDALFPDQFVTARLKMDTLSGATLVPGASVQRRPHPHSTRTGAAPPRPQRQWRRPRPQRMTS